MSDVKAIASAYLTSLINKTLRITTSDMRMFHGEFKCTDCDRNIILARTYEYRLPAMPLPSILNPNATTSTTSTTNNNNNNQEKEEESTAKATSARIDLTSRYLGLVVVPGEHIQKIEIEEFASQVRGKESRWLLSAEALGVAMS